MEECVLDESDWNAVLLLLEIKGTREKRSTPNQPGLKLTSVGTSVFMSLMTRARYWLFVFVALSMACCLPEFMYELIFSSSFYCVVFNCARVMILNNFRMAFCQTVPWMMEKLRSWLQQSRSAEAGWTYYLRTKGENAAFSVISTSFKEVMCSYRQEVTVSGKVLNVPYRSWKSAMGRCEWKAYMSRVCGAFTSVMEYPQWKHRMTAMSDVLLIALGARLY